MLYEVLRKMEENKVEIVTLSEVRWLVRGVPFGDEWSYSLYYIQVQCGSVCCSNYEEMHASGLVNGVGKEGECSRSQEKF